MENKYKITVSSESTVVFETAVGVSVLISMQQNFHNLIKVGCRGGGCGICKVRVVKGRYHCSKMSRIHISEVEEVEGYA